jgi:hypothetical protein
LNNNPVPAVSIITKNGIDKGQVFVEMLNSTLQIPYKDIIFIDDSDDIRTSELVKSFAQKNGKAVFVSRSNLYGEKPTRATARQTAFDIFVQNFNNTILIQLDDDVILRNGWWNEALEAMKDPKIGLFYGITYNVSSFKELASANKLTVRYDDAVKKFYERGRTDDIALRREAIIAVKEKYGVIPPELNVYEDAWVLKAILCSNYKAKVGVIGALHYNPTKAESISVYDKDIEYIRFASKYGIIRSVNFANDLIGLLAPIAGYLPWLIKNAKKFGWKDSIKITNKKQFIKLLYRYVKVKSRLSFSCKKLIWNTQMKY